MQPCWRPPCSPSLTRPWRTASMPGGPGRPPPWPQARPIDRRMLQPDATIGILGGGQLGRMLALAAARLGFKCHVFCPEPASPAFDVVRRVTEADYGDVGALSRFADDVDVITYEFENIPASAAAVL